jgi:hypothetical protein
MKEIKLNRKKMMMNMRMVSILPNLRKRKLIIKKMAIRIIKLISSIIKMPLALDYSEILQNKIKI